MDKASNQLHGKTIEDIIKSSFRGASDNGRKPTSIFDIEASFDKEHNLSTSIKSSKKDTIELADARRFWKIDNQFRLIICKYVQKGNRKKFNEIIEIIITKDMLNFFKGTLNYETIENFHNELKKFEFGRHKEARLFAKEHKKQLEKNSNTYIKLNPKIDSENQRRLQCSININIIKEKFKEQIVSYNSEYRGICLPIEIISEARKFKKN